MNRKFLQFTIGAATALPKALISANADYLITMPATDQLVLTAINGAAAATDVITITFTTADATYRSHYAVVDALALANSAASNPDVIIIPVLPLVGATQQLITSVGIA
jgi:hypothetical protein